jgi:hypothetical protein
MRPHHPAQAAEVAEVQPEEAEALAALQIHCSALPIIDFQLQLGALLPESFVTISRS